MWTLDPDPGPWLQTEALLAGLSEAANAHLRHLELAWRLDSTNASLLARTPPPVGTDVLLAEAQRQGRGRRGRHWESPVGAHLYLSLLRCFLGPSARLPAAGLVAGLAVVEALQRLGVAQPMLKWPNDVQVQDRKLAGVLVEAGSRGPDTAAVPLVIGIGINVRMPVSSAARIDQPWIDLRQLLGEAVSRTALAAAVLDSLLPALDRFDQAGLDAFREAFVRHDALRGRRVRVIAPDGGQRDGIAQGIDPTGALRVADADGEWRVHAGEVSVRTAE